MRLGVLLPAQEPAVIWAVLAHAEANGYAHAWAGDGVDVRPHHEPLLTLAFAAARTSRIQLGTAVLLTALRDPVLLAGELSTLDDLAQGRLLVGVGLGHDHQEPASRLEEHLEVWRERWSGRAGPQVLITPGNGGLFARHGDGIIATDVEPGECLEIRRRGQEALAEAGRDLADFPLAVYVTASFDGALAPFALAGVTDLVVRFEGADQLAQLERFSAEVKPVLELGSLIAEIEARAPSEVGWGSSPEGVMFLQSIALGLLPRAGLDLELAREHAQTFLANFPPMSLPFGDVDQRAARWLAQLLDEGPARAGLRGAMTELAAAWEEAAPAAARQLRGWSAGDPPADPRDDSPWLQALIALARTQLAPRS